MVRSWYEPPDPFELFEGDRLREEQAKRDKLVAEAAAIEVEEAKRLKEARERVTAHTLKANKRVMVGEYIIANVPPPFVDERGDPKYSLSFLLHLGWTIEELGGGARKLVAPNQQPQGRRESGMHEQGS